MTSRPDPREPLPALSQPGRRHVRRRGRQGRRHQRAVREGIGLGRLRRRRPARPLRLEHGPGPASTITKVTARFSDVASKLGCPRSRRTASPAGSGTTTTTAGSTSTSTNTTTSLAEVVGHYHGHRPVENARQAPALPQPRRRGLPRRHPRGRLDRPMAADGLQLRRHRQRRLSRHLPRHRRGCPTRV